MPPHTVSNADSHNVTEGPEHRDGRELLQFGSRGAPRRLGSGASDPATSALPIPRWKRRLDLLFIILSVPVLLPLVILIVCWLKLISSGPLFFRQERIGYRGKKFVLYKFRSMGTNVSTRRHETHIVDLMETDVPMTKLDSYGDPRLIPGGRFLRATGLDELPQLLNVLRGEMSFVGPRPCTPTEFEHYLPSQKERVNALPGLTGYWQVNGKNNTTFSEMIAMDTYYVQNLSARLDLAIMLRTAPAILKQVADGRKVRRSLKSAEGSLGGTSAG